MGRGRALKTQAMLNMCIAIMSTIQPASVRACAYQLFNRKLIPSMVVNETQKVSRWLTIAREEGLLPWKWIVDETRAGERAPSWDDPENFAGAVTSQYRRDRWADQPCLVEVWSEKGTVRGTLAPVLNAYGVTFRVMHGFGSATAVHEVAEATAHRDAGNPLIVLYVGDWDPSGLFMSEADLPERLARYGGTVEITRLALRPADVQQRDLPSFSVDDKHKDPRYRWFKQSYGDSCWELDAMNPVALRERVKQAIVGYIEPAAWNRHAVVEQAERESLTDFMGQWQRLHAGARER